MNDRLKTTFGELRANLQAPPSTQTWQAIVANLIRALRKDREAVEAEWLPYVREHIERWPEGLRVLPWFMLERARQHTSAIDELVDGVQLRGIEQLDAFRQSDTRASAYALTGVSGRELARDATWVEDERLHALRTLHLLEGLDAQASILALLEGPWGETLCELRLERCFMARAMFTALAARRGPWPLEALSVLGEDVEARHIDALLRADLPALRDLALGLRANDEAGEALGKSDLVSRLTRLRIHPGTYLSDGADALLCALPAGLPLEVLEIQGARLRRAVEALPALEMPALRVSIFRNHCIESHTDAWSKTPWLGQLTHIDLCSNCLHGEAFVPFAHALAEGPLETLRLSGNRLGDESAAALASTPLPALRWLTLEGNLIGPEGARALANASWLKQLVGLELAGNHLGDQGALELLEGLGPGAAINMLTLGGNSLGDPTGRHLLDPERLPSALSYVDLRYNDIGADLVEELNLYEHNDIERSPPLCVDTVGNLTRRGPLEWDALGEVPEVFWELLERLNEDPETLQELSTRELVHAYWLELQAISELVGPYYDGAPQMFAHLPPGTSEDGVEDCARAVVAQGRRAFYRAMSTPYAMPRSDDDYDSARASALSTLFTQLYERHPHWSGVPTCPGDWGWPPEMMETIEAEER